MSELCISSSAQLYRLSRIAEISVWTKISHSFNNEANIFLCKLSLAYIRSTIITEKLALKSFFCFLEYPNKNIPA